MAVRKTRQKIKDHVDSAINHLVNAAEQLNIAAKLGEERSGNCYYYIPQCIELLLAARDMVQKVRDQV